MKWLNYNNKQTITIVTILFFVILMSLNIAIVSTVTYNINERYISDINYRFLDVEHQIDNYFDDKITLFEGFASMLQSEKDYEEVHVQRFFEFMLNHRSTNIEAIYIMEESSISWVFPFDGNESLIGYDVGKLDNYSMTIEDLKANPRNIIEGPITFTNGPTSYVLVIPIQDNEGYWGLISAVLGEEAFEDFLNEVSLRNQIDLVIYDKDNDLKLVHGDTNLLQKRNMKYEVDLLNREWIVYVVPSFYWYISVEQTFMIIILSALICVLPLTFLFNRTIKSNYQLRKDNRLLERRVDKDPLTGLLNRSAINSLMIEDNNPKWIEQGIYSMIVVDLDHFKRVNDEFGHDIGDKVLVEVADTLKKSVRKADKVIRWGGEELLIILQGVGLSDATRISEKIRRSLEDIEHPEVGVVTASFGVAQRAKYEYWESWFGRADQALYESKNNGRNRVTVSDHISKTALLQRYIRWDEGWSSGQEKIDHAHKELLNIGNKIARNAYNDSYEKEFLKDLDRLVEKMMEHFEEEETILKTVDYPFLEEHHQIHEKETKNILAYVESLKLGEIDRKQVFEFVMKEVVIDHIIKEDVKYFIYLNDSDDEKLE